MDEFIKATQAAFVSALERGDAAGASALYTADARLVAPSAGVVAGRDEIAAFWQAGVDAGICGVELQTLLQRRSDPVAYEMGSYSLRLRLAEGGSVVDRGNYLLVYERQADGAWRRALEMFNPEKPTTE